MTSMTIVLDMVDHFKRGDEQTNGSRLVGMLSVLLRSISNVSLCVRAWANCSCRTNERMKNRQSEREREKQRAIVMTFTGKKDLYSNGGSKRND